MISINEAKRLIKRALLANLTTKKQDLAITPLVSGKHGIGKSQMVKSIARDLGGVCITIEGGTLKEGEITGLPYQYKDENGQIRFRFLPYYAVERIQAEEKRLFELSGKAVADETLSGDENRYAQNDLSPEEKIDAMRNRSGSPCDPVYRRNQPHGKQRLQRADEYPAHSQCQRLHISVVGVFCGRDEPQHAKQRLRHQ